MPLVLCRLHGCAAGILRVLTDLLARTPPSGHGQAFLVERARSTACPLVRPSVLALRRAHLPVPITTVNPRQTRVHI
jgi:hypothetical protein